MVALKEILLFTGVSGYSLVGAFLRVISFINPPLGLRYISRWTRIFCRFLRFILKIRVVIEGDAASLDENGNFIVSNHLGYLDGVVLGSLFAVVYISKSQVKNWPLFGWMTQAGRTIFIDRKRKNKSLDYIQETVKVLKRKINVLIFPEGTSTKGERLYPFQSVHFQSPLDAGSPIVPVVITYTKINGEKVTLKNRDSVCWYGQNKFSEHVRGVLQLTSIEARVVVGPKINPDTFQNYGYARKDLSEFLHNNMANSYPLFR